MISNIIEKLNGKRILILGYGIEGKATLRFLRNYLQKVIIGIADKNPIILSSDNELFQELNLYSGPDYLDSIPHYDVIIKSPGISTALLSGRITHQLLSSQTDLFLSAFANQTIGITGTKGKSTTASLIYSILSELNDNIILVGNMGSPPFDELPNINEQTKIVFELSSHQLENVNHSPHIGILLNIFEEHLDHYKDYKSYQIAKWNIAAYQKKGDYFICNCNNAIVRLLLDEFPIKSSVLYYSLADISSKGCFKVNEDKISLSPNNKLLDFTNRVSLPGEHNLENIMAAALVGEILNIPHKIIERVVVKFKSLSHRLEFIGELNGVSYYNDSISTIPEATIAAIKTLKRVDVLILGGYDRGIDYKPLAEFLSTSNIPTIIFSGKAGHRIYEELNIKSINKIENRIKVDRFSEIKELIRQHVKAGSICLLSPAASSYDEFNSFKERGDVFKKIAENI